MASSLLKPWARLKRWVLEREASKKWRRIVFWTVIALPVPVFGATYALENTLCSRTLEKIEADFQFVFGNWPPSKGILDHQTVGFALLITFRFALIYGSIAAVLRTLAGLRAWQGVVAFMNYIELMNDRDDTIQNELRGLIPQDLKEDEREALENQIKHAFDEGAKLWEEKVLPAIVGNKAIADKIIARLHTEQVPT
jgi:hypothetical protein